MNINDNLKRRAKPLDKGVIRPLLNPRNISYSCQMVQLGHYKAKKYYVPQKRIHFCYVKLHGFHGNTLHDIKEWVVPTKLLISQQQLILED